MLNILWNTQHYFFWLMLVSLLCFLLERLTPWRPQQKAWRDGIWQDFFWLIFNGHYAGIAVAHIAAWLILQSQTALGLRPFDSLQTVHLLSGTPLWLQFVVFMVLKDLAEWCVHNLLHRVPWLWQFHKLHHSIVELDWIGNMRFHWMEIVVYKSLTYLPLVVMGIDGRVILWVVIVGTLIGHLNHSNLKLNWGPLRYILNSPCFHVWHHDVVQHGRAGQNSRSFSAFGTGFSAPPICPRAKSNRTNSALQIYTVFHAPYYCVWSFRFGRKKPISPPVYYARLAVI